MFQRETNPYYIARKGETKLPPQVKKVWREVLKVRKILLENIKVGPTAEETLNVLIHKLEEAGYIYIDKDIYNKNADPLKTQVHIDFHSLGREISYEDAPRISPLGPDWSRNLKIPLYHTFALEYMIHMPVPEWGKRKHLYICVHDGALVTEGGLEFPYPPLKKIRMIR